MDIVTASGIAARIWCDQDYSHVAMNVEVGEQIASLLLAEANRQEAIAVALEVPRLKQIEVTARKLVSDAMECRDDEWPLNIEALRVALGVAFP